MEEVYGLRFLSRVVEKEFKVQNTFDWEERKL